jgi:YVTN family beta-propeller protein
MNYSAIALLVLLTFLSPAAAQTRVYVAWRCDDGYHVLADASCQQLSNSNYVSVIDASTNRVTTTIPITLTVGQGFGVGRALAVSPDGKRVYLAGGNVSVIDTTTNKVVTQIGDVPAANSVAITPDGKTAYVR